MKRAVRIVNDLLNTFDEDEKIPEDLKNIWRKYDSISFRIRGSADNIDWAVTEKVHGANFAIITNGKELIAARRTSILRWNDDFFPGWQKVVDDNKQFAFKALKLAQETINKNINVICIYGELFGGLFEHQNSKYKPKPGIRHVQKNIYYSPNLHFFAFDIVVNNDKNEYIKLEFNKTLQILKQSNFLYAEPLFIGSLKKCKEYVSENIANFISTIPGKLRLPQPTDANTGEIIKNIAEGYVYRKLYGEHAMFKKKTPMFREIIRDQRKNVVKVKLTAEELKEKEIKNAAKRELKGTLNKKDKDLSVSEFKAKLLKDNNGEDVEIFDLIECCVNENRYASVMSKVGILTRKNVNKMKGMYVGDVWQELLREKSDEMKVINKNKKKKGILKKYCNKCVEQFFVAKIAELNEQ
eukprot:194024_1